MNSTTESLLEIHRDIIILLCTNIIALGNQSKRMHLCGCRLASDQLIQSDDSAMLDLVKGQQLHHLDPQLYSNSAVLRYISTAS